MDQIKIGKLIAKLRKEKGMTQRELGDKVGVGFKAVSKWERGITCPDISIINELSKILGITSDELLTGELSKEHQVNHQNNKKLLLIIPAIILIIGIIFTITKYTDSDVKVYKLTSDSEEYYAEGKITFEQNNIYLNINTLKFINKKLSNTMIKNYMYSIECNNNIIISYGYLMEVNEIPNLFSIKEIMENFSVNYEGTINMTKKELINGNLELIISFIDENDNTIQKIIPLVLN